VFRRGKLIWGEDPLLLHHERAAHEMRGARAGCAVAILLANFRARERAISVGAAREFYFKRILVSRYSHAVSPPVSVHWRKLKIANHEWARQACQPPAAGCCGGEGGVRCFVGVNLSGGEIHFSYTTSALRTRCEVLGQAER